MTPHFRYDKCVIILQLPHGGVGQVSRLTGAQKSIVSGQDLVCSPEEKVGYGKEGECPEKSTEGGQSER